jgi:hypothetical protein
MQDSNKTGLNFNPIWMLAYPSEWSNRGVLFSAKMGDSIDLWRIQLARDTWQITGAPEQLLSGAGFAVSGSTANDGRVAFASLSRKTHVWSLPLDAASGTVRAEPEQLTDSRCGGALAFDHRRRQASGIQFNQGREFTYRH